MQQRDSRYPNLKCPECQCYSISDASRICAVCQSDYSTVALVDDLFGSKNSTLERDEVELTIIKKMVIEVDPRKFNELEVKTLKSFRQKLKPLKGTCVKLLKCLAQEIDLAIMGFTDW